MAASGGQLDSAIDLHVYNCALSGAFLGPLQMLEVTLRNAFERELISLFGCTWYDNPNFLIDQLLQQSIEGAKKRCQKLRSGLNSHRMIAELHFGFWTTLCDSRYDRALWRKGLVQVFKGYKNIYGRNISRSAASRRLDYLRNFRNRIVHHEPIFSRALWADYESILEVSRWISPGLDTWIDYHSRCRQMIPDRRLV